MPVKEDLLAIIKSKTFKALVALVAAALTAWATHGCASVPPKPSLAVLDCQVSVLEPYLGALAQEAVREINGNQTFNPVQFLLSSGVSVKDISRIATQYQACAPADDVKVRIPAAVTASGTTASADAGG